MVEIKSKSEIGINHLANQDCIYVKINKDSNLNFFAGVADGIGGLDHGELASKESLEKIYKLLDQKFNNTDIKIKDINSLIKKAIQETNKHIIKIANKKQTEIGTTLTFVVSIKNMIFFGHVGDTSIYAKYESHDNKISLSKLTIDHNLNNRSNVLSKYIGMKNLKNTQIQKLNLVDCKQLILMSDGITGFIDDENILNTLNSKINDVPKKLIELSKKNDSYDDMSIIVITLD
tara:strand:- start:334 stop:1032 length:699 start_codon:yes stop_codon:yes gene_type:complete